MTRTLILGGARSGKSRHAEALAATSGKRVVYVATAQANDTEMSARIAMHRQQRDANWQTLEESILLGEVIRCYGKEENIILIDCLTLWLSNLLFYDGRSYPEIGSIQAPDKFHEQRADLLQALKETRGDVILVSNEVGNGIVPVGAISRWFVDEAGRLHQEIAAVCDKVTLIVAGLPLSLKG